MASRRPARALGGGKVSRRAVPVRAPPISDPFGIAFARRASHTWWPPAPPRLSPPKALLTECNLHTLVRRPNGVFNPSTGIRINLPFFTKGTATTHVWHYEHPNPPGAKSDNKGKPIRLEEFEVERLWWGAEADGFKSRVENEQAWRVSIDQIKPGNFNPDLKNPHNPNTGPSDVDHLLPEYEKLLVQIAATRAKLKQELMQALK